jgi:hypothetical protein
MNVANASRTDRCEYRANSLVGALHCARRTRAAGHVPDWAPVARTINGQPEFFAGQDLKQHNRLPYIDRFSDSKKDARSNHITFALFLLLLMKTKSTTALPDFADVTERHRLATRDDPVLVCATGRREVTKGAMRIAAVEAIF